MKEKKSASILKKFLLFNFLVFSVLGLFTFLYIKAIQPKLVQKKTSNHIIIIKNTSDHLDRLKVKFSEKGISTFLLSTRFLFQSIDRVQFFDKEGDLIGDTDTLDLDQGVFSKNDSIIEEDIDGSKKNQNKNKIIKDNNIDSSLNYYNEVKNNILYRIKSQPLITERKIK